MIIPHFVQNELSEFGESPASGAIDSLDDRLSAFNFCNPFDYILPFVDGTIGAGDRAHLWGLYAGIAVGEAVPPTQQTLGVLFINDLGSMMNP